MAEIIAKNILQIKRISIKKAKDKYHSYFVKGKKFFSAYKEEVDRILVENECDEVIINE